MFSIVSAGAALGSVGEKRSSTNPSSEKGIFMLKHVFLYATAVIVLTGCVSMTPQVTSKSEAVAKASLNDMGKSGRRLELPSMNTGTGAHDFYSLFALLPPNGPAKYGIGIAAANKFSTTDATLSLNGEGPLKLEGSQDVSLLLVVKVNYLEGIFDRAQLEKAVTAGGHFQLASSKGSLDFNVPGWMFASLLEAADQHDSQRRYDLSVRARAAALARAREAYVRARPEMADDIKAALLQGKLMVGMIPEEADAAWGTPEKVDDLNTPNGMTQFRTYSRGVVFFVHGKLASWQTFPQ